MAREMVLIGCKLPHGLVLTHPANPKIQVTLRGLKDSKIIGADYITTEVDAEFWAIWKLSYTDYAPVKTGAIFECKTAEDAVKKSKDASKTGFEPLAKESLNVKTATKD